MSADLTFRLLRETNTARCDRWHSGFPNEVNGWTAADWSNAMQGEQGELAEAILELLAFVNKSAGAVGNAVKKVQRLQFALVGNQGDDQDLEVLLQHVENEAADTAIYLDLLMTFLGRSLESGIVRKFNEVSERNGFPERLPDYEELPDIGTDQFALGRLCAHVVLERDMDRFPDGITAGDVLGEIRRRFGPDVFPLISFPDVHDAMSEYMGPAKGRD